MPHLYLAMKNISFEAWVKWAFDHPITSPEWYFNDQATIEPLSEEVTVEYLTKLFTSAPTILAPFSDDQINQGLNFIIFSACSDHIYALESKNIPWLKKRLCVHSMFYLFKNLFSKKCTPHLSHLNEPGANPINQICYMWWDLLRDSFRNCNTQTQELINKEYLLVMEKILELESIPCTESALHGLGHWEHIFPNEVHQIIDDYLITHKIARRELRQYAESAKAGIVL